MAFEIVRDHFRQRPVLNSEIARGANAPDPGRRYTMGLSFVRAGPRGAPRSSGCRAHAGPPPQPGLPPINRASPAADDSEAIAAGSKAPPPVQAARRGRVPPARRGHGQGFAARLGRGGISGGQRFSAQDLQIIGQNSGVVGAKKTARNWCGSPNPCWQIGRARSGKSFGDARSRRQRRPISPISAQQGKSGPRKAGEPGW